MQRLADYFLVVGYDHDEERGGRSCGKIIQRFPDKDWPDCPFNPRIIHFCQPQGWVLTPKHELPTFFISILTDLDGLRHYCACLTFHQTLLPTTPTTTINTLLNKNNICSDEADDTAFLLPKTQMYAPKCLLLTSKLDCFEAFRNCLGIIYTAYVEPSSDIRIETLVGNILGSVNVPPPGGHALRFSIGADDRQVIQPPASPTVPCTGLSVYNLFKELGIDHVVTIFCAALSDIKILFFSKSYWKLTEACKAVESLLFPLKYCYTFIPVLPFDLIEVLDAPTPFIIGVHSDQKLQALINFDGLWIDLDGASVHLTENVKLAPMPETPYNRVLSSLFQILKPDIHAADLAFPLNGRMNMKTDSGSQLVADYPKYKDETNRDKQIRSIFIRLFAELFAGYRSCLLIIRINPKPVISFHKASFLGHHRLVNDEFMLRVLDSMSFHKFIEERGPPFRSHDIFDDVYAVIYEQLKREKDPITTQNYSAVFEHIKELANQLLLNENPSPQQTYTQKVPQPSQASCIRDNLPEFPHLNKELVNAAIKEGLKKQQNSRPYSARVSQPCIVKLGTPIQALNGRTDISQSARRLEVLKQCVSFIFSDKIAEARKTSGAVFYSIKSHEDARIALCNELASYKKQNKPRLNNQQFEMIANLLNCALEASSSIDEHGIAYMILTLATTFHRKLSEEATQFIYTDIQRHAVWANMQFWEMSFYSDVQLQIRNLYLSHEDHNSNNNNNDNSAVTDTLSISSAETVTQHGSTTLTNTIDSSFENSIHQNGTTIHDKTALEIAAEQMRLYSQKTPEEQRSIEDLEEQTLYALAIHYIQLMVYMKLPLDISSSSNIRHSIYNPVPHSTGGDADSLTSDFYHSSNDPFNVRDPDETSTVGSHDSGHGFDLNNDDQVTDLVLSFVRKFVDKVCDESGVNATHKNSLHTKLYQTVQIQIEVLEKVYRETRRVAPMPKPLLPRFVTIPELFEHEESIALRSYLLPDGRDEFFIGQHSLLPAEGALIMTNYRLIFKGRPVNPAIANDYLIVRSFPISSLIREKKLSGQFRLDNSNICLHNGIQLRSATFQLIKVFFDDEVLVEDVERFRAKLVEKRYPESVFQTFCFSIYSDYNPVISKQKDGTLKKYGRYARNVLRKKGLIPPKELTSHQNITLKSNGSSNTGGLKTLNGSTRHQQNLLIRTPEPARRSLTLANARSPKSLTLQNSNDRSLGGISTLTTPSTIHECDEGVMGNNSDDEDEDRLSSAIDDTNNYATISNETKSLERFTDSFVYKDFVRQGLIVTTFGASRSTIRTSTVTSLTSNISSPALSSVNENNTNGNGQSIGNPSNGNNNNGMNMTIAGGTNTTPTMSAFMGTSDDVFRISHINRNFGFCRSYPLVLVLPKDILDESLKKVARCHKLQRVPVIVWRNPRTKSLLLRGSAFCNKGFINLLVKGPQTNTSSSSDTNASIEQERYFDAIVKLTPTKMPFSADLGDGDEPESIDITPLSVRKTTHHSATNRLQNLLPSRVLYDRPRTTSVNIHSNMDTLPRSDTASYTSMNSPTPSATAANGGTGGTNGLSSFDIDFNESILQVHKRSPLYIIGDRAQHRTGRLEQFQNYCFLPLEFHDVSQIKTSFKKMTRACVPSMSAQTSNGHANHNGTDISSVTLPNSMSFYKLIEESRWLYQLQKILMISVYIVQFIEDHASSVMICVEDGWDTASQLVSISELLLDPYYRTFEGFQTLIEREWFAFGHRFSHRSNQTAANKTGFAPVFLQFLDLVHQIWSQFPTEFEFNEYYLRFLAYHHLSNRFKNFMLDCDCERKKDRNWYVDTTRDPLAEEISGKLNEYSIENVVLLLVGLYRCNTINIWDYVSKINRECSRFYNFLYSPSTESCVLRPSYKMYSLDIWDFYLSETLETGCPYDLDIALAEHDEHLNDAELRQRSKCLSAVYDDISICLPDFFNEIVSEMSNTLAHTNGDSWKTYWDKIEKPEREKVQRLSMQDEAYKRMNSTPHYLHPQRSLSSSISSSRTSSMYGSHTYELTQFSSPQICDTCDEIIDSKKSTLDGIRALQCRECSNVCHEKCRSIASCRPCRRIGTSGPSDSQIVVNSTRFETGSVTGVYDHHGLSHSFTSSGVTGNNSGPQHRTHEGYLRKRGHLLKQWKERWFVLDSVRHELRYYDSSDDQTAKGVILLADAVEILPYTGPFPNALRRFDSRAAFELHTNRRIYNFIAATPQDAQTWTDKIKSCLLDS
ncbi:unnamed protein product [Adineta ricciae]|uniref:Myotubularin-related protein 13 n=1 Tax=Adineta ricciae TaxID=249248 RepID=A0A814NSP0_ADIRI|nr:unnamed protein product [Adineta ricciae]